MILKKGAAQQMRGYLLGGIYFSVKIESIYERDMNGTWFLAG
jgi:hypothetical protein